MQLSGRDAAQYVYAPQFDPKQVQPATVDLTMASHFLYLKAPDDGKQRVVYKRGKPPEYVGVIQDVLVLHPGQFMLGSTQESLRLPEWIAGRIEGKSTLGRLGIIVHITAGFIDPGYSGRPTLEFYNVGPRVVEIHAGDPVAQLALYEMKNYDAEIGYRPQRYDGHYQNDSRTTGAQW